MLCCSHSSLIVFPRVVNFCLFKELFLSMTCSCSGFIIRVLYGKRKDSHHSHLMRKQGWGVRAPHCPFSCGFFGEARRKKQTQTRIWPTMAFISPHSHGLRGSCLVLGSVQPPTHKNPSLCRVCPSWPFVKLGVAAFLCQGRVREAFWCLNCVFKSVEYSANFFFFFWLLWLELQKTLTCWLLSHLENPLAFADDLEAETASEPPPEMFCMSPLFIFYIMACPVTVVWPQLGPYMAQSSFVFKENFTVSITNSTCRRYWLWAAGIFISFCGATQAEVLRI